MDSSSKAKTNGERGKSKRAESLLAENRLLKNLMENLQLIAVILDPGGSVVYCNDYLLNLTGWQRGEVIGANWFEVFVRSARGNLRQRFEEVTKGGELPQHYERPIITKAGLALMIKWNNTTMRGENGEVIGVASIGEDVTEKKRAENELRRSNERLQVFFHQSLDGFFFCHFDYPREWRNAKNKDEILEDIINTQHFSDVNDAMLKQYTISREDFLKLTTRDVFAHDLDQGRRLRRELFDKGRLHLETSERKSDGTPVWFEGDYVCLYDGDGRVTGFFGIQRDITDRKQSEIALREAEEKYRGIFENAVEGIYQSSPEGRFITVNPAFARMLGYDSPQDLIESVTDIAAQTYGETFLRSEFMRQLEEQGSVSSFEYQMRRKDGRLIWTSENSRVVCDAAGKVLYYEGIVEDITKRKDAESALLESEWRNRVVAEMTTDYTFILDVDPQWILKLRWASENMMRLARRITDKAPNIFMWKKLLHPEDLARFLKFIKQLLVTGDENTIECRMALTDDKQHWVEISAQPLKDANGSVISIIGAIKDVTERKQAEVALKRSEDLYRRAIDAAGAVPYMIHHDEHTFNFIFISQNILQMTGYSAAEMTADLWNSLILEGFPRGKLAHLTYEEANRLTNKDHSMLWECDFRIRTRAGQTRWIADTSVKGFDEKNGSLISIGIYQDITERKEAEEQLLLQSAALNAAANSIMITDQNGEIEWANPAYMALTGYSAEEVIGKNPRDLVRSGNHPQGFYANMWETILSGKVWQGELINRRKDGSTYFVDSTIAPILGADNQPTHFIGVIQDITERKRNEQRMDKQLQRLNALHAIDNAINSSTDLNTTLTILLKELVAQLKVDAAAVLLYNKNMLMLEYIISQGFRLKALPHLSLGFNQGYAGQVVLERRTIHISDLKRSGTKEINAITGKDFAAYIGVPLIAKGQIVGVLEIFQNAVSTPDQDWFDFLDMLAGQTAIAINNSQLFENLQHSNFELTIAYDATIEGWSRALDLRDEETEGHTQRVTNLTLQLARQMGITDAEMLHIRRGALLHDIGKMGIPDTILLKPGSLTEEEWGIMRRHTLYAQEMLVNIPYLRPALDIPLCHHEKWDGSGYPQKLRGVEIPLAARIFAVVDVYDALTSDRPYRAAWSKEKTLEYIKAQSGKHFDPAVANAFLMLMAQS